MWCPECEGTSSTHLVVPFFSLGQGTLQWSNPARSARCWGQTNPCRMFSGTLSCGAMQSTCRPNSTQPGQFPRVLKNWIAKDPCLLLRPCYLSEGTEYVLPDFCLTGLRQLVGNLCKAVVNLVCPSLFCLHTKSNTNTKSSISHPSLFCSHGIQFKPKISTKES